MKKHDPVDSPEHYTWLPDVECLDVVRHFDFCCGNAIKYIWRSGRKGTEQDALDDLRKAIFYLNREIEHRITQERQQRQPQMTMVNGKEIDLTKQSKAQ